MRIIFYFVFTSLLFISCVREDYNPQNDDYYIMANVNGNEWKSQGSFNPNIALKRAYPSGDYNMTLIWKLDNWTSDFINCTMYIVINYPFPVKTERYYFNNDGTTIKSPGGVGAYFQGWETTKDYINYSSTEGYVDITYADYEYVEGIFTFTAIDNENKSLKIKDGKFKAKITQSEG